MHFAIVSKYTVQSFLVIYVTKNYFKILNICWWTLKSFQTEATSMCRYQWGLVTSQIFTDELLSMPPIWSPPIHPPGTCTCVYAHLCTLNICVHWTFVCVNSSFSMFCLPFSATPRHLNQNQCEAFSRNKLFPPPPIQQVFFSPEWIVWTKISAAYFCLPSSKKLPKQPKILPKQPKILTGGVFIVVSSSLVHFV